MKLKIEIVKKLLEVIEEPESYPYTFYMYSKGLSRDIGIDADTISYHLCLMLEAGFIKGKKVGIEYVQIYRMTWKAHEFLANSKNPTLWKQLKELRRDSDGFSIDVATSVLASIASKFAHSLIN
jgi:hypothetical protein